ncbi:MAG TPA: carbohydrate ABC transporter permease [Candidatus Limnocylindrales bacterium]|jgi:alpha-glucoside transport system permease protein|nr:carbohydrate ABC transporter permease [Candidatus Limnocylindrales bacterium]
MTAASTSVDRAAAATGRRGWGWSRIVLHVIVISLMLLWVVPTLGLFVNSFRPASDVAQSGWWNALFPPWDFTLDNYSRVIAANDLGDAFINSLFITIPSTVIPVMVAAFAAYAFAWMNFPFKNAIFVAIVGLLVIPLQSTLIPVLRLLAGAGIAGEFLAVWLAHTGYGLPFAVYLLRNYMGSLPREVFESAAIDGANPATAFFRLALPMSVPVIASLAIFQFLFVWNDLLVALIYIGPTDPENLPMTVRVASLVSSLGGETHFLTAAAFLTMILPLVVFLGLQRYFVRGITGGAVKG